MAYRSAVDSALPAAIGALAILTLVIATGATAQSSPLWVGTRQATYDIYTSGHVSSSVTSETVNISANGAAIYVRLWYYWWGAWVYQDYKFTEAS